MVSETTCPRRPALVRLLAVAMPLALAVSLLPQMAGSAEALPSGFTESTVFSGLTNPVKVAFAADGRVFVAEKSGIIKVFDSLTDTTPTVFADLQTKVYDYWDRGLLGFALAPNFPTDPTSYVLYTYDAAIGATLRLGPGVDTTIAPRRPGPTADGCVISGRLSRLQASGNVMTGSRAGAHRGLVPAVPEPSVGDLRVRVRRGALRQRR